ncbi:hypothetical protein HDU76_001304 [Blyttiomyces sp. JEL0837]|nr:hypothetical protein HDU76_001304 [Blyttiomyces sp. JEL0837]
MFIARIAPLIALVASTATAATFPPATQQNTPIPAPPGLESDAEIAAICAAGPSTQWEKHVCSAFGKVQTGCMPQRRFPYGAKNSTNVKGAVILYHGFSACPDAMEFLAADFQSQGYLVYIPLVTGHGIPIGSCDPAVRPGAKCVANTPIDQLPTSRKGYQDFAQWSVSMFQEEVALQVPVANRAAGFVFGTAGLSLGGPMATMATYYGNGLFNNTVLVNPFFSAALPALDFPVKACQQSKDPQACISKFIDQLDNIDALAKGGQSTGNATDIGLGSILNAIKSKALSVASWAIDRVLGNILLNHYVGFNKFITDLLTDIEEVPTLDNLSLASFQYGWGAGCVANVARPGYCNFEFRELMAISAFGMYSLSRTTHIKGGNIGIMGSVRDGYIREGVIYSAASTFAANNKVSMCVYLADPACNITEVQSLNDCGVPHSCFSRAENLYNSPYQLYWEKDLFDNIVGFIGGSKAVVGTAGSVPVGVCNVVTLGNLNQYSDFIADSSSIVEDAIKRWSS